MTKLNILITDRETNKRDEFDATGYLLIILDNDKINLTGRMDLKTLAPILTKILLEKLIK